MNESRKSRKASVGSMPGRFRVTDKTEKMMTNQEALQALIREYGLTHAEVADLVDRSVDAVRAWLKPPSSRSHRRMPDNALRLLRLELANRTRIQ